MWIDTLASHYPPVHGEGVVVEAGVDVVVKRVEVKDVADVRAQERQGREVHCDMSSQSYGIDDRCR